MMMRMTMMMMMMMMTLNSRTTFILNVKAEVIPIITGVSETISKSFRKYPSNMPKQDIKQLQTSAILGTAHIFGKVLV
jgi:hypothetical protein